MPRGGLFRTPAGVRQRNPLHQQTCWRGRGAPNKDGLFPPGPLRHPVCTQEGLSAVKEGDRSVSCGNASPVLAPQQETSLAGWSPRGRGGGGADPGLWCTDPALRTFLLKEVALNFLYKKQSRTQASWSLT